MANGTTRLFWHCFIEFLFDRIIFFILIIFDKVENFQQKIKCLCVFRRHSKIYEKPQNPPITKSYSDSEVFLRQRHKIFLDNQHNDYFRNNQNLLNKADLLEWDDDSLMELSMLDLEDYDEHLFESIEDFKEKAALFRMVSEL